MFLNRIELQGFKSFVDKTELHFGDGITGVIGPNGCGKTNVSDAIRWVMGEQSAKQLRGGTMEDVIFNGCPTRKPLNLAEVHLTFKNDRGILPTEFSEVTISRRVFRSGVSEYFLNKAPCRLRDIRDLFFDTGMGSHAYSVIERSMVDHVLSDNSGHRRFLFEEAAGITKYKARKREALGKLDATDIDLTRLGDIVFELERELRSLARQVGKARRFQRLRDEIRDLDLALTASRVEALKGRETEVREQWQEESTRRGGLATEVARLEAQLNDQKLALLEVERELSAAQGGLRDREEERSRAEQQIVLLRERAAGLTRRADEAAEEAGRMRGRLAEVEARQREAGENWAGLRARREAAQADAEAAERALSTLEAELRLARGSAGEAKQSALVLFTGEADARAVCERLGSRRADRTERRDAAGRRRAELEVRLAELQRLAASGVERRATLEADLEAARAALAAADVGLEALAAEAGVSLTVISKLREEAAAAESRLSVLLDLKRNFDGVSEGVKALLSEGDRLPGLLGVVADVIEVPGRLLDALEASLGEAAAFVLIEGHHSLEAAVERLRAVESGRATLVDLSTLAHGTLPAVPDDAGVVGRASDLVRCAPHYRSLVERLLGSVVVVEDRAVAARLAAGSEGGLRFVSLDGEVWERGRVRAGSARSLSGLLHREGQIRELNGQLADLALAIEGGERERGGIEARRRDMVAARTEAGAELDRRRAALEGLSRELEAGEHEARWAATEAGERRGEIAAIESEIGTLEHSLAEAGAALAVASAALEAAHANLGTLDGTVQVLEARRDEAAARAQVAREGLLQLAREEGECGSEVARAEEVRRELETGLEARGEEQAQARAKVIEIGAEVEALASGLTGLLEVETGQRELVVGIQRRFLALKEEVQAGEDAARQKRFGQAELGELIHQLELERVQTRAELDRTFERLRTEYQMDTDQWVSSAPPPEGFDQPQAQATLEEARQRYRALGPVNLLALDEYTKKKDRYQFLVRQREDLTSAKTQLLEAIEKINVTASDLFRETFGKVQDHFRDIFRTLFEGGDAELRMVGEDPLECEIEIAAKPRGKFLQSISLMSGGERALTAIALLFALYLVKPSPFCLLDEVDAPLDDANVDRFLKMLQRFSDKTQFVVITHNKKTMESARCLYGVTMQELGVSKLVSVRFDGQDASTPGRNGHALAEVGAG
jgi:chromosome segregation protein